MIRLLGSRHWLYALVRLLLIHLAQAGVLNPDLAPHDKAVEKRGICGYDGMWITLRRLLIKQAGPQSNDIRDST